MNIVWKDVTSWSRGDDKSKGPRTVEARVAWARVVVTRHIHYSGWLLLCDDLGIGRHRQLKSEELVDAEAEALGLIRERVRQLADALKVE